MPMYKTAKRQAAASKIQRAWRSYKARKGKKVGKARPMRNLKLNYRAINVYRFMRETLPQTTTFSLIAQGAGSIPQMGYMSFENLQLNQLPGVSDFTGLFARYKVDKIITTLIPMVQEVISDGATTIAASQQLEITRVNTKYMNNDFPISATAEDQLKELAQIQSKSKSLYSRRRRLTLTTINPGVVGNSVVNSSGNEVDARRSSPWLSLGGTNPATNVPFKHNAIIFGARIDGNALSADWKYRVTHKIFFRCSQVG